MTLRVKPLPKSILNVSKTFFYKAMHTPRSSSARNPVELDELDSVSSHVRRTFSLFNHFDSMEERRAVIEGRSWRRYKWKCGSVAISNE